MFAIKMMVDNFAACCCFQEIVASIEMSFNIMTSQSMFPLRAYLVCAEWKAEWAPKKSLRHRKFEK